MTRHEMKTKTEVLNGKPDVGNRHVQFGEGEVALVKPWRGARFYKWMSRALAGMKYRQFQKTHVANPAGESCGRWVKCARMRYAATSPT